MPTSYTRICYILQQNSQIRTKLTQRSRYVEHTGNNKDKITFNVSHTKCIVLQTRWTLTDNGTRCDGVEDDVKSVGLLRSCMNRA